MEVIHLLRFVRNNCPYNAEQKCLKRYILYRRLPLIGISGTVWSVMHVLSLGVVCIHANPDVQEGFLVDSRCWADISEYEHLASI